MVCNKNASHEGKKMRNPKNFSCLYDYNAHNTHVYLYVLRKHGNAFPAWVPVCECARVYVCVCVCVEYVLRCVLKLHAINGRYDRKCFHGREMMQTQ